MADDSSRPNPNGRSENDVPRPERPKSRCQPIRPVSPFTDWSSLSDNDDNVISVHSDGSEANYEPRLPAYEPESPGPVQVRDDSRNRGASDRDSNERPRSPLGRGSLLQGVSPFLRGIGQRRRHDLGRLRPM